MMSKAKWFVVRKPLRKPSRGEIIATSANQIVPQKIRWRYGLGTRLAERLMV